ncbi:pyrophosphate--fructose 6-phosphate 1-phosphotransferase subunit beta-like [Benincasa hispida]|uniref:pyrophosphate--fructose 6-phosphate 1-phosphotransferase subunit beta-like n=1 Tax=Benincasa hispida TaxID=102211 RepID=UPI0018FFAF7B|nr:pyrophosphate--fructose 6-phosphate 1-phosphotransferase subunit beta-like [Benincasa hispida]
MSPPFIANVDVSPIIASSPLEIGCVSTVYSEVQAHRIDQPFPFPSVLKNPFKILNGPPTSAASNPKFRVFELCVIYACSQIAKLFPGLFGQPSSWLISSFYDFGEDYLQVHAKGSTLYDFKGGPFKQAEETAQKLDLDGLVVNGGDDSNINACLLAENFRNIRSKSLKTRVIGCPKTIYGDLKCKGVSTSFGFETCKIYSEMIDNVMVDARSIGKYYHYKHFA